MTHTDRHFRYFLRLISSQVMLYTEMMTSGALIHGNSGKYLAYNQEEHPVAIQLGGNNAKQLAQCAVMAMDYGYDEVNLNVGCPSDRVQSGKFGACLMLEPDLVAECVSAMQATVNIPVSVKCRIGVDEYDSYETLFHFIDKIFEAGCKTFIIHARKAILDGLSPRQNREVPPLKYDVVHRIKKDFPDLEIIINGGFTEINEIKRQFMHVDGVMIGRVACNNPCILAEIDQEIFGIQGIQLERDEILQAYCEYVSRELATGTPLSHLTRNIFGIFHGQPGAREYRRFLSENIYDPRNGVEIIEKALACVKAA